MPRESTYARRNEKAREEGWSGYPQKRYWLARLDDDLVRELAEEIGGPVEPEREGSLMSRRANEIVNAHPPPYRRWVWQVRLLSAAGRIGKRRRR